MYSICICTRKLHPSLSKYTRVAKKYVADGYSLYLWDKLSKEDYHSIKNDVTSMQEYYFLGWDGVKAERKGTLSEVPFNIDIVCNIVVEQL